MTEIILEVLGSNDKSDVLALKGKLQENEKTEESMQNFFFQFSDKAHFFREAGGFEKDEVSFWA